MKYFSALHEDWSFLIVWNADLWTVYGSPFLSVHFFDIDIFLTAIEFKPGGSNTVQYTFTHKHYTKQHNETEYNTYLKKKDK